MKHSGFMETDMSTDHRDHNGVNRRKVLECMTWAGTGVLWTVAGGVPRSLGRTYVSVQEPTPTS